MNKFKDEILKLKDKKHIDKKLMKVFLNKAKNINFVREESPAEHFCSFFLPIDEELKSVFLGHHLIADDWIPPGGHTQKGEGPRETVIREFKEELDYKINDKQIELFDISIIKTRNAARPCKFHYDFWYLVNIKKRDFNVDKKEFYKAQWFSIEEAIKKTKRDEYKSVLKKLLH